MTQDLELQTKDSRMTSQQGPLRVIYIAGVGRSGSTVLDSVLGNHPLIHSAGELSRLASEGWIQNFYCSCGNRSNHCCFWSAVREEWRNMGGTIPIDEYIQVQNAVESFRQWPSLRRQGRKKSPVFQLYAEQTVKLLKSIQKVSGCAAIVDSSKSVERAFAFSVIPDIDLKVIQLVRDPRGVVWSHRKAFTKDLENGLPMDIHAEPAWRAALYWCRMNLQADWLRRRAGPERALLIRYEDFMLHTLPVLEKISGFIGIDLENVQRAIGEEKKLSFDHTIAGNRVRMKGDLKLNYDQEWRQKLPARDRRLTEILTGWLMKSYGYQP